MMKQFLGILFLSFFLLNSGCDKKKSHCNDPKNSSCEVASNPFFSEERTYGETPNENPEAPIEEIISLFNDPLLKYAWHLGNTGQAAFSGSNAKLKNSINIFEVWKMGYTGKGVEILVSDDGGEIEHEDLADNVLARMSKNYALTSPWLGNPFNKKSSFHGTAVSGIISGVGNNQVGALGVAPNSKFAAYRYLDLDIPTTDEMRIDQASNDFDIYNYSYGSRHKQLVYEEIHQSLNDQFKYATKNFREKKGAIYIKAAGNSFYMLIDTNKDEELDFFYFGDSNLDGEHNTPYTIVVGAINAKGEAASYSSPGSNIWISAPGGEYGYLAPAIITTDIQGCKWGLSNSESLLEEEPLHPFDRNEVLNPNCSYTAIMNGTSAATPVLSGVVALILEANPELTWRDVKYILAKTANTDLPSNRYYQNLLLKDSTHPIKVLQSLLPSDNSYSQGWVTNAAGVKFHNWYGFGKVDAHDAVKMAISHKNLPSFKDAEAESSSDLNLPVPNKSYVTNSLEISEDHIIEAVQIKIDTSWSNPTNSLNCTKLSTTSKQAEITSCGQYAIELISPQGTRSILLAPYANRAEVAMDASSQAGLKNALLLSNAFFGESSLGKWTLKVIDPQGGYPIVINNWSIKVFGH